MKLAVILLSSLLSFWSGLENLRIPCVLIEFQDVRFEDEKTGEYFQSLLNEQMKEYFRDNSLGAFTPEFDIYGPVTLNKYRAFYGNDILVQNVRADAAPELALAEACRALDEDVDFSVYDADADGVIDMVLYIYAGHDQSQGAPHEAIWAHNWSLSESTREDVKNVVLDEVLLDSYFCASQFRGKEGRDLCGIGLISHEFGHALGLPDFYDQVATGGKPAADLSGFSLMCYGYLNNLGFTPPYLNAEERMILGWMERESLQELKPGRQTLSAIRSNTAYKIPTLTEGEYFLLEYRDCKGWDAPLPEGLVVYHVDRSEEYAPRWENWQTPGSGINDDASHPCFYIVQSSEGPREDGSLVFPGKAKTLSYEPVDWQGNIVPCQLTNIEITPEGLSLYAHFDCARNINGYVRNVHGDAIEGATLLLNKEKARSDADGHFFFPVADEDPGPFTLKVSAPGYRDYSATLALDNARILSLPVTLTRETEGEETALSKYDVNLRRGYYTKAGIGAVRFRPEDLAPYAGCLLKEVVFYPYLLDSFQGEIYVTVDIGRTRVLTRLVETPVPGLYFKNTLDVSDAGIVIPEGEDMYIGYGSADSGQDAFFLGTVYPGASGNREKSKWSAMYVDKAGITMNLMLQASVKEQMGAGELTALGYSYINPGNGAYQDGGSFSLELVTPENALPFTVNWYYDDQPVKGGSVVLRSGHHVLEAMLEYESGVTETLRKEFEIK